MVYLDWSKIMSITPENFTDDDKEDLLQTVAWYSPTDEIKKDQFAALVKVLQEIIKYKIDQVESLMGALEELAAKQGEEVARIRQELLDELEELREQVDYYKRMDRDDSLPDNQLRSELVRLEMQNEELLQELQERDKDLTAEKTEVERLASEVARLEREKLDIVRELAALQEETNERVGRGVSDSPEGGAEKVEELVELVRQKNKHIMQLLDDIEAVEQDNQSVKVKLANLRDQLTESTGKVAELKEQVGRAEVFLDDEKKRTAELESKNYALCSQISEMAEKIAKNDTDLDEFAVTLISRVEEWKRLIDMKDIEIQAIRDELNKSFSVNAPWNDAITDSDRMSRSLQQEQEIIKLKKDLAEALYENKKQNEELKELREKISNVDGNAELNLKVETLETQIIKLKEELNLAEEDAIKKAGDITKLVVQLRTYEREEYGLSDAVDQIKKLEKRLSERDINVENAIAACNQLGIEKDKLEDENIYLRDKLGLSPSHTIDCSSVKRNSKVASQTICNLQKELEKVKDEMVDLKLQNREMKTCLKKGLVTAQSSPKKTKSEDGIICSEDKESTEKDFYKEKYFTFVEENDALRKALHEILEGIQHQTMGDLQIHSLERLLEALDARHISGWYHPAMRLQAQVNATKGECTELRNQIRTLREEKMMLSDELEAARSVNKFLEGNVVVERIDATERCEVASDSVEAGLENNFDTVKRSAELELVMSEQKLEFNKAKGEWECERRQLIKEKDSLAIQLANIIGETPPTDPSHFGYAGLSKAVEFLQLREAVHTDEVTSMQQNFMKEQEELFDKLVALTREKTEFSSFVSSPQSSVQIEMEQKIAELENALSNLKLQHSATIASDLLKIIGSSEKTKSDELNVNWEKVERRELLDELRAVREKLYETEALLNGAKSADLPDDYSNQLSILASKLSAAEVRETSERQKNVRLEKMNEILKAEQNTLLTHCKELSEQLRDETEFSHSLQEALKKAEQIIQNGVFEESVDRAIKIENKLSKVVSEKKNIEDLLIISRSQYRSLQTWRAQQTLERDSYNECLKLLLTSQGEKFAVLKLNHELIACQKNNLELGSKNAELKLEVNNLKALNLTKEAALNSSLDDLRRLKTTSIMRIKHLFNLMNKLHNAYGNALMFPTVSKAQTLLGGLQGQKELLTEKLSHIGEKERDLAVKEEEINIQLEALQDLKAAFHSDSKNLVNWHNKSTELRLRECRLRKKCEFLLDEVSRLENQVKLMANEIMMLEEKILVKERESEDMQNNWHQQQLEFLELLDIKPKSEEADLASAPKPNLSSSSENLKMKIDLLETANERLFTQLQEKEVESKFDQLNKVKSIELEEAAENERDEKVMELLVIAGGKDNASEKTALLVTISSLQSIILQKEDTVAKYQQLLKKTREEHANTVRRLQNELKNVHNALASQSKAYSRIKHGTYQPSIMDIEKFVNKVQELEEEVADLKAALTRAKDQIKTSQQDVSKWREEAEEKKVLAEEIRERLELELERCREEIQSLELELHDLRKTAQDNRSEKLLDTIQDLQSKLAVLSAQSLPRPQSYRKQNSVESDDMGNESALQRQLKSCREENIRLRAQLTSLRETKRRPISSVKSTQNRENLVDKIRKLEELLQLSKQHEHELEEQGLKKIRSVEEVTRWDERKRHQKVVERLENKLKQKEVEVTVAVNKVETMRGLMAKMERDKTFAEAQIRNYNESARTSSVMETLLQEKAELTSQVNFLEEERKSLQRHESGKAAAMLHSKLEEQERRIASLQMTNQAPATLAAELDHLKATNSALERSNVKLESENLKLKLNFEKMRVEAQQLNEICRRSEVEKRAAAHTPVSTPSKAQTRIAYDNQREINRLKLELKVARDKLAAAEERNAVLEDEIQRLLKNLSMWEEKDLVDNLAKSKQQQIVSDLHKQLIDVKSQLSHKVHLLDRVKILLSKAAAKEKALNEKVSALQTIVEQSR